MAQGEGGKLFALAREQSFAADHEPARTQLAQCFEDRIEVTGGARVQDMELQSERARRRLQVFAWVSASTGLAGLTSSAMTVAVGTTSRSSSSCFGPNSKVKTVTPVRLPPGRFKLATSPAATGSVAVTNTTGMAVVAALAASVAGVLPGAAMTVT